MHDIIFKFQLHLAGRQKISLPIGAQILSIQEQNENICLWAMIDSKAKFEERTIELIGTGQPFQKLNPDQYRVHLDTIQIAGMVWHLFEIIQKPI